MTELIIEDGSLPVGANSYADIAAADAYALARAPAAAEFAAWLAADTARKTALLIRATDVLNSYAWKGAPVLAQRLMAWPRAGVAYADGTAVGAEAVPPQVAQAQCELAAALLNGAEPLAAVDTTRGAVLSEGVAGISISYAAPDSGSHAGSTGFPAVDALLRGFLAASGGCGGNGGCGMTEAGRG